MLCPVWGGTALLHPLHVPRAVSCSAESAAWLISLRLWAPVTCGFFSAIINHSCPYPFAVHAASVPSGLFAFSTDMWFGLLLRKIA